MTAVQSQPPTAPAPEPTPSASPPASTHTLPAGGPDPQHFDWTAAWYPVAFLRDLDPKRLARFTILEQDLVIWWDRQGQQWRAMADRCPHRLAPLSEGRIAEDGLLECPYHGWAFTGAGACDRIPQMPEGRSSQTSPRACVRSYPTTEHQGLLFVYPGPSEWAAQTPVPTVDAIEEEPDQWVIGDIFRDLPYDALTLLENVLDSSHVPFTHHKSVGNRSSASPVELEVLASDRQGFQGFWADGPRKGTLGSQHTRFIAPALMWHDLTSKQFGRTLTVVYVTPIRKGQCRVFARFPFKFASARFRTLFKLVPRWYSHLGQNAVLEDDQIFLHWQERYFEQAGGSAEAARAFYLPTRADRFVLELHRWIQTYQAQLFPHQPLPLPRTNLDLLDRYHSHTENCPTCLKALDRIQTGRMGAVIVAIGLWSIVPLLVVFGGVSMAIGAVLLSLGTLTTGSLWLGLGRLERKFYQGRRTPPRNLDAGISRS
ncbi:MAG: Rieske 2Fe-2S domain-containing protein [Prochlorothrix sp.]|nr:Rieske 2Fe-2S domain-containing protein [Prochlorothrix sp.]